MDETRLFVGQLVKVKNEGRGLPKCLRDLAGKRLLVVGAKMVETECDCCDNPTQKVTVIDLDGNGREYFYHAGHFIDATTQSAAAAA